MEVELRLWVHSNLDSLIFLGGIEPSSSGKYKGTITVDMMNFNKIKKVDPISRTALIQAGIYGPELESQLKQHNLTMRHFPQR
jgi:alkyldihydroxyacetonephosphate synthase